MIWIGKKAKVSLFEGMILYIRDFKGHQMTLRTDKHMQQMTRYIQQSVVFNISMSVDWKNSGK